MPSRKLNSLSSSSRFSSFSLVFSSHSTNVSSVCRDLFHPHFIIIMSSAASSKANDDEQRKKNNKTQELRIFLFFSSGDLSRVESMRFKFRLFSLPPLPSEAYRKKGAFLLSFKICHFGMSRQTPKDALRRPHPSSKLFNQHWIYCGSLAPDEAACGMIREREEKRENLPKPIPY